jgi:hypothetical protein
VKSFRPEKTSRRLPTPRGGRNPEADFHGRTRSIDFHASMTDPPERLYRKGRAKKAGALLHGACGDGELRGLIVDACLTEADGHAARIAALHRIEPRACAMIVSAAGP